MADISVTAANVKTYSGATVKGGTAGATITAGQTIYKDSTVSDKLKPADADASLAAATIVGVALNGASLDQPVDYISKGGLNPGGTVAVGTIYLASPDAGGIQPHGDLLAGDYVSIIGVGTTTSRIEVNIQNSGVAVPA